MSILIFQRVNSLSPWETHCKFVRKPIFGSLCFSPANKLC